MFENALMLLSGAEKKSLDELDLDHTQLDQFTEWLRSLEIVFETDGHNISIPAGIDLLDSDAIHSLMPNRVAACLDKVEVLTEIDSTNSYLFKKSLSDKPGTLCLAERQTAGRGRRGRSWVSPFGTNLYMSLLWRMPLGQASIEGLSLAIGVAVVRGLNGEGFTGFKLKWPNDLLLNGGKVAGILIEMKPATKEHVELVVGVGINLNMPETSASKIDQPWQDLSDGMKSKSRNQLAAAVVSSMVDVLVQYPQAGFAGLKDEWDALDAYYDKPVELHLGPRTMRGLARGVDNAGAIKILIDGGIQCFHGGEISLRLADDSRS